MHHFHFGTYASICCSVYTLTVLQRTSEAIAWMEHYFSLVGDHMPHRMGIHLPSSLTKTAIYQRLVSDMKARDRPSVVSQAQFFKLWEDHYSNVTIPKVYLQHIARSM